MSVLLLQQGLIPFPCQSQSGSHHRSLPNSVWSLPLSLAHLLLLSAWQGTQNEWINEVLGNDYSTAEGIIGLLVDMNYIILLLTDRELEHNHNC